MITAFYITFFVILAGLVALFILNEKLWHKNLGKVAKIMSICLVVMFFINIFLPDLFAIRGLPSSRIGVVNGKADYNLAPHAAWLEVFDSTLGRSGEIIHTLSRIGLAIAPVSLPFAIFFSNKKNINRVVSFVVLPFALLGAILYFQYIKMFTFNDSSFALNEQLNQFGDGLRVVLQNGALRSIWFGLGLLMTIMLSVYVLYHNLKDLKFEGYKDVLMFVGVLAAFIFTNMPIYTAQHLFHTYTSLILTIAYPGHFIFIGLIAVEAVILYFVLRNRSYEDKYIVMLVMAISLLMQYNTFFKTDGIIVASRWPFQLCNIAGAFIIITLLTKSEKMFHFTLVVNSLGAFIAIAICDSTFNTGILYEMNIHYMVEHINVLLVPIMCGILKMFKPLKKEDVIHVIAGFAVYWVAIFVVGTILCSLQKTDANSTGFFNGVNYLFMFDAARSAQLVGFAKPLFDVKFEVGNATFTLAQIVILVVFEALCVGVFFLFFLCFKDKKAKVEVAQ